MANSADPSSFKLSTSTAHLLHRVQQLAVERFAQIVGSDVTLRQFAVLAAISENPGLSQTDLVYETGIDRSTLADMMTRMEKRNWVTRMPSNEDGRAYCVRLGAEGYAILKTSLRAAEAADAAILDEIKGESARENFKKTVRRLAERSAKAVKHAEKAKEKAERKIRKLEKKKGKEHEDAVERKTVAEAKNAKTKHKRAESARKDKGKDKSKGRAKV